MTSRLKQTIAAIQAAGLDSGSAAKVTKLPIRICIKRLDRSERIKRKTSQSKKSVKLSWADCLKYESCARKLIPYLIWGGICFTLSVIVYVLFLVTTLPVIYTHMKKRTHQEWKIPWGTLKPTYVHMHQPAPAKEPSHKHRTPISKDQSRQSHQSYGFAARVYCDNASFEGKQVAVKDFKILEKNFPEYNEKVNAEIVELLKHNSRNCVAFYGFTFRSERVFNIEEYCMRGSLADVLSEDGMQIDLVHKVSWTNEIIDGLNFIHNHSPIKTHGNLKSTTCMLTAYMSIKLTDFGVPTLRRLQHRKPKEGSGSKKITGAAKIAKGYLWKAPELLRQEHPAIGGTQKGDVYSFAIVIHELIVRKGVFGIDATGQNPQELIETIKNPPDTEGHRPTISEDTNENFKALITDCWAEDPASRPRWKHIKSHYMKPLQDLNLGRSLYDYTVASFDWKAKEVDVQSRSMAGDHTSDPLVIRMAQLVEQIVPHEVLEEFCGMEPRLPHQHGCATIMFMDIKNFTVISDKLDPEDVASLLNELFDEIDIIVDRHQFCRKIESIGDAYMVASGLPRENENHATQICRLACEIQQFIGRFVPRHQALKDIGKVEMRCGVHSGDATSGIIGLTCPRWVIFGETVKIAEEMEKAGEPGKVNISGATYGELIKIKADKAFQISVRKRSDGSLDGVTWEDRFIPMYWLSHERISHRISHQRAVIA